MPQTIHIHALAPAKPLLGAACNGCGVCCVAEPCPVSRFWLRQRSGSCRALQWNEQSTRYTCGMMQAPAQYLSWLPQVLNGIVGRFFAGWLAAGEGCDSDSEVID